MTIHCCAIGSVQISDFVAKKNKVYRSTYTCKHSKAVDSWYCEVGGCGRLKKKKKIMSGFHIWPK